MIVPDITDHNSADDFLATFLKKNREESPKTSIRYWAKRLKWPLSYFNQVISRQKPLTLRRCVELGRFLQLDDFAFERLILLALKSDKSEQVASYANDKLELEKDSVITQSTSIAIEPQTGFFAILAFELLKVAGAKFATDPPMEYLYSLLPVHAREIQAAVQRLIDANVVTIAANGTVRFLSDRVTLGAGPESGWAEWRGFFLDSYNNAVRACSSNVPHFSASHGFVWLPLSRMEEIRRKFYVFLAALEQIDCQNGLPKEKIFTDYNLYQYCWSMFPVLDGRTSK